MKNSSNIYQHVSYRSSFLFSISTRVIKPNGPDIGRKVKVKTTGRTIPSPSPSNSRYRESASIPTSVSQPKLSSSYKPAVNNQPAARNQPEKKVSEIMRRPLKWVSISIPYNRNLKNVRSLFTFITIKQRTKQERFEKNKNIWRAHKDMTLFPLFWYRLVAKTLAGLLKIRDVYEIL